MRGGFGARRNAGFERPAQAAQIDTFEQALYPPRKFNYFPPSMLIASSASGNPAVPSSAVALCENKNPLRASDILPLGGATKVTYREPTLNGSTSVLSAVDDIVRCFDMGESCIPRLGVNEESVLKTIQQHPQVFGTLHSMLPMELRIWTPAKNGLTEQEKKMLYRIRPFKRPRLEKPVRRGGVVVASSSSNSTTIGARKSESVSKGRGGKKPGESVQSALVDIAAIENDDSPRKKRDRGDDDDGNPEEGEGDAEDNVSSLGDVDDDDDGLDDVSGAGSGDELMF